jgi:hypothetical protein
MIKVVNDIGAPVAVVAADLISESFVPQYNEAIAYVATLGGYMAAWQGKGGDFAKNIAIASLPWAAKKIYTRVKGMGGNAPISRKASSISRNYQPEFKDVTAY